MNPFVRHVRKQLIRSRNGHHTPPPAAEASLNREPRVEAVIRDTRRGGARPVRSAPHLDDPRDPGQLSDPARPATPAPDDADPLGPPL